MVPVLVRYSSTVLEYGTRPGTRVPNLFYVKEVPSCLASF